MQPMEATAGRSLTLVVRVLLEGCQGNLPSSTPELWTCAERQHELADYTNSR